MAKIVMVKRPMMLGLGANAIRVKPGRQELDDVLFDKWYVQALINSGDIVVEVPKIPVVVDESKLVEVSFPTEPAIALQAEPDTKNEEIIEVPIPEIEPSVEEPKKPRAVKVKVEPVIKVTKIVRPIKKGK